jgi:hypothetical protein
MGVLVGSNDTKVLIDALFDKPNPDYRAPEPGILDKIMKGEAPFDGVKLALVTHNHPDHFAAEVAVRFLESQTQAILVAPADAVAEMRKAAADWPRIESRIAALDIKVGEKESRDPQGIPLTACRTLHSGDGNSPMNLMYLFEIDGRRVWHEGDPNGRCEIFQTFGLNDLRLDLAIVHFWYPLDPNCSRFFQEDLKVDHIALGHLPIRLESDAPGKIDMIRKFYKDIFLMLPGMPVVRLAPAPPQDNASTFKNGGPTTLSTPYLGQKPPGDTPELFAPGFVSTKFGELNSVFSKDGKEFYFSRRGIPGRPSVLMATKWEGEGWSEPGPLPFCGTYDDIDLFLCPDNQRLIFCSSRPRAGAKEDRMNHDFWVSRRNGSGWSDPEPFAPEAVSPAEDYFPVVTLNGTVYFNSQREGRGTNDIYASKFADGKYLPAEKLPAPINTEYREFDAFVTLDERTIIFSSERPGGFGGSDIYVSFRDGKGGWSEPANLGPEINSERTEYGATVSPDGRFLFFTSTRAGNEDIYWVSAKVIDELRPKKEPRS